MKAFGTWRIYTVTHGFYHHYKWLIRWVNPQKKNEITLYGQYIKYTDVVGLLGVFRPTREFFTHIETSPLPVKGCKYWTMLGMKGHWAVGVLKRDTGHQTTCIMIITCCRLFSSGAVTPCFNKFGLPRTGFEHSTFRKRVEHSNRLRHPSPRWIFWIVM